MNEATQSAIFTVLSFVMNPPNQQQVVLGNNQYPSVAPVAFNNPNHPDEKLWGANVRRIMGILQIICGGIECVLGIAVILVTDPYYFDRIDYVGWGIWNGAFAIVTGFLGVFSSKKKGMVIAYMITSIIAAVLSACCFIYAVFGALFGSFSYYRQQGNQAMYIILCIVFFTQMVISIVGASFTCGAVCSSSNQPQQVVYYTPQPLPQQYAPTPPYTVVASQGGYPSQTINPSVNGAYAPGKI